MQEFEKTNNISRKIRSAYKSIRLRYWGYRRASIVKQQAHRGDAVAQAILGTMYSKGIGVSKDYNVAFNWYLRAANQGNISAQLIVGTRYAIGKGVTQNHPEAFRWYFEAAGQNNPKAQMVLELMYTDGNSI